MTTARDVFQASCYAALARHTEAIGNGTWRVTADNAMVDALLKAWEKSMTSRAAYAERGVPAGVRPGSLEGQLARLRAEIYGDTPEEQAERRAVLDAYAVRRHA